MPRNVSQFVQTASAAWKPSKIPGVFYMALNSPDGEKHGTFLYRMDPKTPYPRHRHTSGEEILLLKGDLTVGERKLKPGDFLFSPAGTMHEASTETGCMFLISHEEGVELISEASTSEFEGESVAAETTPGGTLTPYGELPEEAPETPPKT